MRVRRARTLVVTFVNSTAVLRNFMAAQAAPVDGLALDLLLRAGEWQDPASWPAAYPAVSPQLLQAYVQKLTAFGFLVAEGTPAAAIDLEYERFWAWDAVAGFYHFGVRNAAWLSVPQAAEWLQQLAVSTPPIPLWTTNDGLLSVHRLPPPDPGNPLLSVMKRRRSVRSYREKPADLEALSDCLWAGLGITGFLNTGVIGPDPWVPLKMTPSGGGRNPYEAFVIVRDVTGLDSGLYHYSAIDHTLGLVAASPAATPSQVFAGQGWTDKAAFGVLLVANFARTMWKYPHPNAYRVVLVEAGHIGQNIALAAAAHGLSATPTGAVDDAAAQALLGLDWVRQSLVYAMFVGLGDPQAHEVQASVEVRADGSPVPPGRRPLRGEQSRVRSARRRAADRPPAALRNGRE